MNTQTSIIILQLANTHANLSTEQILERAEAFRKFVDAPQRTDISELPPTAGTAAPELPQAAEAMPANDPGTKRVRRTKEQIAADAAKTDTANPMQTAQPADMQKEQQTAGSNPLPTPAVSREAAYKDLQDAMIALVTQKGDAAAIKVLAAFGITAPPGNARQLAPERYEEFTKALLSEMGSKAGFA